MADESRFLLNNLQNIPLIGCFSARLHMKIEKTIFSLGSMPAAPPCALLEAGA
jgi:hypothetical protein